MMAWMPQLPSTTWVTPKSTATELSEIDRRFLVDVLLRGRAEFFQIVGEGEAVQDPFVLGFEKRIVQGGERAGELVLLVQDELEGAGERHLDGGAAQFGIALRGVR